MSRGGAELRFLRFRLDLSQKQLAGIVGSAEQNIRRWEKARKQPIPGPAEGAGWKIETRS